MSEIKEPPQLPLIPRLPNRGTARCVKHRENDNPLGRHAVVNAEREASNWGLAEITNRNWISIRLSADRVDDFLDFLDKLLAQTRTLTLVPSRRIAKFLLSDQSDD
jgi:hypothetical protein